MSYEELVNHIKEKSYLRTRSDVVRWLMGYQFKVGLDDLDNIEEAYKNYLID